MKIKKRTQEKLVYRCTTCGSTEGAETIPPDTNPPIDAPKDQMNLSASGLSEAVPNGGMRRPRTLEQAHAEPGGGNALITAEVELVGVFILLLERIESAAGYSDRRWVDLPRRIEALREQAQK
jgi:hypothetical protein